MEHPHLKKAIEFCDLCQKAIKERYSWEVIDSLLTKLLTEFKEGLKAIEKSKPGRKPNRRHKGAIDLGPKYVLPDGTPSLYKEGKE